jgi:hypothetical protein
MNKLALLAIALLTVSCSSDDDPSGPAGSGGAAGSGGTTTGGTGGTTATGGTGGTTATGGTGGTTATGGTGGTTATGGTGGSTGGTGGTGGSVPEAGPDAPDDVQVEVGPVSSCDELSTIACFANNECESDRRCQNAGTDTDPVPCCVLGARGTGQAGDPCTNENDCESGVCIAGSGPYMCSKPCTTEADCPAGMKDCKYIYGSGSDDDWCFPKD